MSEQFEHKASETIRRHALSFPRAEEGSSCVNRAFSAGGKNFAFLGEADANCRLRLKLDDSIPELERRAEAEPSRYQVGKHGWVLLEFPAADPPSSAELQTWMTESFHLLAPKKIRALLDP